MIGENDSTFTLNTKIRKTDNTSLFKDITVSQLKNCDIVVHRTAHIVLWKGLDVTTTGRFFTYEATTSGLDKCKPYDLNWSSLSGYSVEPISVSHNY